MEFIGSLGAVGWIIFAITALFAFLAPFFIYGTWNQVKEINKTSKEMLKIMEKHTDNENI